jgi:hypothetical protein
MVSSRTVLVLPVFAGESSVLAGEHDVFWAEDDVFAGEHGKTSSSKPLQRKAYDVNDVNDVFSSPLSALPDPRVLIAVRRGVSPSGFCFQIKLPEKRH